MTRKITRPWQNRFSQRLNFFLILSEDLKPMALNNNLRLPVWMVMLYVIVSGCALNIHHDRSASSRFNPLFFPEIEQSHKESRTPFLGIYMEEVPEKYLSEVVKKQSSVYIKHVISETAAERAGILIGDIVIAVDGKPLNNKESNPQNQLRKTIREKKIGDDLKLSIIRDNKPITVEAKVEEMKKIPALIKPHPEIDNIQKSMDKVDSEIYSIIQDNDKLEGFLNTMGHLREKTLLLDSYKIAPDNPFRLREVNYILQNPTNTIPVSRGITNSLLNHLGSGSYDLTRLIHEASKGLDVDFHLDTADVLTMRSLDDITRYIVEVVAGAESYRNAAFKGLSGEEMRFLEEEALRVISEGDASPEINERLLKIAAKVDYHALFKAMAEVSRLITPEAITALRQIKVHSLQRSPVIPTDVVSGDVIDIIETRFGRIVIGGPGKTHYKGNTFVIIDFGGDDLYENNAGASTPEYPFSIVIDLAGNDRYITRTNLSQGAGFMGMGILAEIQGDDVYVSNKFSQGAGIFGGGILIDIDGDDRYAADSYTEGAGIFGIGMLLDTKGNDSYEAHKASQGFASVKGFGALVDISGNDFYLAGNKYPDDRDPDHATKSLSQGFAIGMRPYDSPAGASGGIGVLIDKEGNDKYIGDYFSQGASYWYALGILHDMKGNDTYIAGRYAQGAGIHISAACLIDEKGDDSYTVTFGVSQGMGHDFGIGVLSDFYGNDTYKGGALSLGAATCGGIGVLYDKDGQDTYLTDNGGRSIVSPDDSCEARGFGILMNGK